MVTRRRLLQIAGVSAVGVLAARLSIPRALRAPIPRELEGEAAQFLEGLFADLDRSKVWDMHSHLIGTGDGGSGCRVSDTLRSQLNPVERFRYDVYLAATGVKEDGDMDRTYVERVLDLQRLANPQGRMILLALDEVVEPGGTVRPGVVPFYTPNDYVLAVAREHREFEPGVSIHPYRTDAVERLNSAHSKGARLVKWLPSVQHIDPSSPECDAFYEGLAELGIPLLSHAGEEVAMPGEQQALGNPLLLRRALDAGVKVIMAHGASLGSNVDLDESEGRRTRKPSWELLLRLMKDPRYERQLFADISAITQFNRCGDPLRAFLCESDLHYRLVNGSDYPLPAIDPLISTWKLVHEGYLTSRERMLCNAVYDANPLLFDFAVKRCLKVEEGGRTHRFSPNIFETSWLFS
ncbi:MAG: amidohydrolase family protein [Planctomycetota bacterium]|nr:amidohydrolase family protein [Planctomycetota bacterium]